MADRTKVSFREAEGKPKFPPILRWGEIDQRVRAALWTPFYDFFSKNIRFDGAGSAAYTDPLKSILFRNHADREHQFIDEFKYRFNEKSKVLFYWSDYFKKQDYVELFDFITFVLRDPDCPVKLIDSIASAFEKDYSPYRMLRKPPTIIPIINKEHAETLERDVAKVFGSKFEGAKTHLQGALDAIGAGDHRSAVRESIHAVESAVRDFTSDPNAILSRALRRLTDERKIHRALSDAFEKLYAYSSDEKGIRHALVFSENENVGFDEAIFFLSACSAFVGYLSVK